jgi:hypothetical protein
VSPLSLLSHSIILIMATVWPNCATLKQLNDTSYALISLPHHDSLGRHVSGLTCCNFTLLEHHFWAGLLIHPSSFMFLSLRCLRQKTATLCVSFHELCLKFAVISRRLITNKANSSFHFPHAASTVFILKLLLICIVNNYVIDATVSKYRRS